MGRRHRVSRARRRLRRREEPSNRRTELLGAALEVIRRDGPSASMEAMAAEAGITKPILYRNFGDRDGLLAAVAYSFADQLVARLESALASTPDPRARLRAAIESYLDFIEEDLPLYTFFTQHTAVASPVMTGVVDRTAAPVARALGEGLRAFGADSGPAEHWAYGLVGMVHMAGMRWVANPTLPRERLVEYLESVVWEGLVGFAGTAAG